MAAVPEEAPHPAKTMNPSRERITTLADFMIESLLSDQLKQTIR
jgi:hypothetical protein